MKRTYKIFVSIILVISVLLISAVPAFAGGVEMEDMPDDPPIESRVEISGLNLILSGEIGLAWHISVPDTYQQKGYVKLEFEDADDDEEPIIYNITDCKQDLEKRFVAIFYLSAIELSRKVKITVYDKNGVVLASKTKSAEEYVKLLLQEGNATEKEETVAKTLINYGHYAQLACSEANGWKVGEDVPETTAFYVPAVDASVFDAYDIEWQKHSATFHQFSMSLKLDYKTGILLYVPTAEKPTVTVNGEAVEVVKSERIENNYEFEIKGINALNLEDEYEITVNDATFTLSAFSYCKLAVQHNTSANTIDAMRALYEFYQATVNYNTPAEAK